MKRIIVFDTSIATSNMGDYIIAESCDRELSDILNGNFVMRFPTHTPVSHFYQDFKKFSGGRYRDYADLKFVYGTNLLNYNMFTPTPTWNINIFNSRMEKGVILVGAGMGSSDLSPNFYTKLLFNRVLNKDYYHSVRDEKSAKFLRNMGFKVINTGCATTWQLSDSFCKDIPAEKADKVIFTLTDYKKDIEKDKKLIEILRCNYSTIYFWVQGVEDYNYLRSIDQGDDILIVGSTLKEYEEVLANNIDYVGTRLHAGIKAMQCKRRSIIVEVDNRASDMKESINLHTVARSEIEQKLDEMINSSWNTKLGIKTDAIRKWKDQFNGKNK